MDKKRPSCVLLVIYAIAILFGVGVIYCERQVVEREKASLRWPIVSGKILRSEEIYVTGRNSGTYHADVAYSYVVKGTRHASHQISLWSSNLGGYGGIVGAFVTNHPAGSLVDVYCDPTNPENSVLVPGADVGTFRLFQGGGTIAIVMSIFGGVLNLRRRRRLIELLNDPAADRREVKLSRTKILEAHTLFGRCIFVAMFPFALAMVILLPPLLTRPLPLPGTPELQPLQWFAGIGFALMAIFFFWLAFRKLRRAECPLCGNIFNKMAFRTTRCSDCGTRLTFHGTTSASGTHGHST